MKLFPITLFFVATLWSVAAQQGSTQALPAVFSLGENEAAYEKLCEAHPRTLLAVSNNDIDLALKNWFEFLRSVDDHAKSINFDAKGLRVWLHVFWNTDGTIAHIGFFVMPNSRFFKTDDLKALFSSFIRQYRPKLSSDRNFSHYTSASFPVLMDRN